MLGQFRLVKEGDGVVLGQDIDRGGHLLDTMETKGQVHHTSARSRRTVGLEPRIDLATTNLVTAGEVDHALGHEAREDGIEEGPAPVAHHPRSTRNPKIWRGRRKTWQAQKFERLRCDPNVNAKDNRADEYMYMTTLTVQDDLPELDPAPSLFHLGDEFDAVEVGMKVTFAVLSTTLQRYTAHFGSTA